MHEKVGVSAKRPVPNGTKTAQLRRRGFDRQIGSPVDHSMFVLRHVGNQAVQRFIDLEDVRAPSSVGVRQIQGKLKISQPADVYEQEADRVAEQVMQMPESQVQRQVETEQLLQGKALRSPTLDSMVNFESRIDALGASGRPLPESTRTFFEPRFGQDFSQVRVHTDTHAAGLARNINAKAFTVGQDVVFGAGQYSPNNTVGKKLLAHELTHVVQQTGGQVQREVLGDQIGKRGFVSLRTNNMNVQRDLVECSDRVSASFQRHGNLVEIRIEGTVYAGEPEDCLVAVLGRLGSEARDWRAEPWYTTFREALYAFLGSIEHEIAVGHGPHQRRSGVYFVVNLDRAGGRINSVTLNVRESMALYGP